MESNKAEEEIPIEIVVVVENWNPSFSESKVLPIIVSMFRVFEDNNFFKNLQENTIVERLPQVSQV